MNHVPAGNDFEPLMTLYMTDNTSPEEIEKAHASGKAVAVKLYPVGQRLTAAGDGHFLVDADSEKMASLGMLFIHGEVTDAHVDIFDREAEFIATVLQPLVSLVPTLKVVLEHCTTKQVVDFVKSAGPNVGHPATSSL